MLRGDKVRQAVSLWRALQTRAWRREHSPGDDRPVELQYRFEGLRHLVRSLEAEDAAWCEFLAIHGATALSIVYEDDLEADHDRIVHRVLHHLGIDAPRGWRAAEPLKRQADALSDEWVAAYHRDVAREVVGAGPALSTT